MARTIVGILAGAALLLGVSAAGAQPKDSLGDPSLKGPEVIAFIGVKPGRLAWALVLGIVP